MMSPPAQIEMRPAAAADADGIRSLVRAAYAKWVPVVGREPLPMRADYGRAIREHRVSLLYADGLPAGVIELIIGADYLFIENVAVDPHHQGRGFGHRLLAHAEETAIAHGLRELRLITNGAFASNIA